MRRLLSFNSLFLISCGCLPLVIIPNWGNSFTEPKFIFLLFCLLIAIIKVFISKTSFIYNQKPKTHEVWFWGMLFIISSMALTFGHVQNYGLAYQSLSIFVALLIIPIMIGSSSLKASHFYFILLPVLFVIQASGLLMILFRVTVFLDYSKFGSSIGLKNSFSVFLAQSIPFILIAISEIHINKKRYRRSLLFLCGVVLTTSIWIVMANRTRSAWWMLILYFIFLLFLTLKNKEAFLLPFKGFLASIFLAVILLNVVPDALRWRSQTPYTDSLNSLVSLEKSNGRDKLWQVSLNMLTPFPWKSEGIGQSPAKWASYIKDTPSVEPKVFAFLRADLPLFNDYLQIAAEGGVVVSLIFLFITLGIPLVIILKAYKTGSLESKSILSLVCLGTSLDAFFDYPFYRPESVLLYVISLGLLFQINNRTSEKRIDSRIIKLKVVHFAALSFIALVLTTSTLGLGFRKYWTYSQKPQYLWIAHKLWPWDIQWKTNHLISFLNSEYNWYAKDFATKRLSAWPNDPQSYLIWAVYYRNLKDYEKSIGYYTRAIRTIEDGRCYRSAYKSYNNMLRDIPDTVQQIENDELSICR